MTKSIYLDPDKTAPLEPSAGDERNGSWISPFDIPTIIQIYGSRDAIQAIKLVYPGGETGGTRKPLDEFNDPSILIRSGRHTGKILEMNFGSPISGDELKSIGDRIVQQSSFLVATSTKYNYQMVASIFRQWKQFVGAADQT